MTANINPKSGVPYGVIKADKVPWLIDEIQAHGHNVSRAAYEDAVRDSLRAPLADFDADAVPAGTAEARKAWITEWFTVQFKKRCDVSSRCLPGLVEIVLEHMDLDSATFDIEECVEAGFEHYANRGELDSGSDDGDEYTYEADGFKYLTGTLGGATLIWVVESPFVTYCKQCSPCVPNAGDLDNPTEDVNSNTWAYCPAPADWVSKDNTSLADDELPFVIYKISEANSPGEIAWQRSDGRP